MNQLLTPQQAAERLGTPLRFVRRLIEERRISYIKLGRYVRIHAADLDAFVAAGRVEQEPRSRLGLPPLRASFSQRRAPTDRR